VEINLLIIVAIIFILGIGYAIGYYFGKQDGIKEGILITPILLREESLRKGSCVLCQQDKNSESLQVNKEEM